MNKKKDEIKFTLRVDADTCDTFNQIAQKKHYSTNALLVSLMEDYNEKNKYCLAKTEHTLEVKKTKTLEGNRSLLVAKDLDGESYIDLQETTNICRFNGRYSVNENMLVFGSPGQGKSMAIMSNIITQTVNNNDSVVIYDEAGEMYSIFAPMLKIKGYEVNVIALSEKSSPADAEAKLNVTDLVNYLIEENDKDPFWKNAEKYLFDTIKSNSNTLNEIYDALKNETYYSMCLGIAETTLTAAANNLMLILHTLKPYAGYISFNKANDLKIKQKSATFIIGNQMDGVLNGAFVLS